MDNQSEIQPKVQSESRSHAPRRVWALIEERELILSLKDIVARGWKCDLGFRTGYLSVLEQHMNNHFPGTDLKADPHINSKLHVWKKQYGSLCTMLSRPGFSWNDNTSQFEVCDEQVWNEYLKFDGNARSMRRKTWPFYKDWGIIFGKDHGIGKNTKAAVGEVNGLFARDKGKCPVSPSTVASIPTNTPSASDNDYASDNNSDVRSGCRGTTNCQSEIQPKVQLESRSHAPRRVWTSIEEQELILSLKDIVAHGWKNDNGFRTGYLSVLERHMNNHFPGTDLKADPHINSKIHVWKKQYGSLCSMLSMSGFGWNDNTNQFEVCDDQVWNEYLEGDPNARSMRRKIWPFYRDWGIIFGKDHAIGNNTKEVVGAVDKLFARDKRKCPFSPSTVASIPANTPPASDNDSDVRSGCRDTFESLSEIQHKVQSKSRSPASRRMWTLIEEQELILSLKDIVAHGWKCDNGFRTGYLFVLEQHMNKHFPGTDLKADPHIHSKIHVWKKQYGSLCTMLSRFGFNWNDNTNQLEVCNDQVWNEYLKSDPKARSMRRRTWPFYKDWGIIFGNDRAIGKNTKAVVGAVDELFARDKGKCLMSPSTAASIPTDTPASEKDRAIGNNNNAVVGAVDEMFARDKGKSPMSPLTVASIPTDTPSASEKDCAIGNNTEAVVGAADEMFARDKGKSPMSPSTVASIPTDTPSASENDFEVRSGCRGESISSPTNPARVSRKRSRMYGGVEREMVDMMSTFLTKIESHMRELVAKMGTEHDASEMRKKVFDALQAIDTLSIEEKLKVTGFICDKKKDLDIFFSINDENKAVLARMILDGKYY